MSTGSATLPTPEGAPREALYLRADRAGIAQEGQRIVSGASAAVGAGELVGLIGPSGSGKTTLLRMMAGVTDPTEGSVTLGSEPVAARQIEVGYLPFTDTIHDRLTVREELWFAGRLRLPDESLEEIEQRIEEVLDLLRLRDRADHLIGSLSGGERRRAACAVELLPRPAMLLLDEPATGLDPTLERRLMATLRGVADQGRGVLVATHATSSLAQCDSVAVMAAGGTLVFQGAPADVLEHFDVSSYDAIYDALAPGEGRVHPGSGADVVAPQAARHRRERIIGPFGSQLSVLTQRYWLTLSRDRRTLALLLVQAPVMGLIIGMVLPSGVVGDENLGPFYSLLLLFLLLTASIWMGIISGCREIVREQGAVTRDVAAGVRFDSYLLSKLAVLFPLVAAQVAAMLTVALVIQPLEESAVVHLAVLGLCTLTAWSAVTLGLLVSALSRSVDQATAIVPLMLIPQLLFAGAIIPVAAMPVVVEAVSNLTFARWGLVGLGGVTGLGTDLESTIGSVTGFNSSFFSLGGVGAAVVVTVFGVLTVVGTGLAMDRRLRR